MCKIMEHIILERIGAFFEGHEFIEPLQEGFRKNHSTMNALLRLTQSILMGIIKLKLP